MKKILIISKNYPHKNLSQNDKIISLIINELSNSFDFYYLIEKKDSNKALKNSFFYSIFYNKFKFLSKIMNLLRRLMPIFFENIDAQSILYSFEKIKDQRFDYIFGYSFPFSSILAANYIYRKHNIKYLCYFFDYFSIRHKYSTNNHLFNNYEKKILTNSFLNIFPKSLDFANEFFDYSSNNNIVTGYPLLNHKKILTLNSTLNKKLTFIYSGILQKNIREPDLLVEFYSKLPENCLKIIIFKGKYMKYLSKVSKKIPNLYIFENLSSFEAQKMIEVSDILVNLSNKITYQMSSKIIEYLNYEKPIINLHYENDNFYRYYATSNFVLNVSNNQLKGFNINHLEKYFSQIKNSNAQFVFENSTENIKRLIIDKLGL